MLRATELPKPVGADYSMSCRFGVCLSGDTPGEREGLGFRCVTVPARYAELVTPDETRWEALALALFFAAETWPLRQ